MTRTLLTATVGLALASLSGYCNTKLPDELSPSASMFALAIEKPRLHRLSRCHLSGAGLGTPMRVTGLHSGNSAL